MAQYSYEEAIAAGKKAVAANDIAAANEIAAYIDSNFPGERKAKQEQKEYSEDIPVVNEDGSVSVHHDPNAPRRGGVDEGQIDLKGLASAVGAGGNKGAAAIADLPVDVINILGNVLGVDKLAMPPTEAVDFISEKLTGHKPIEFLTTPTDAVDTNTEKFAGRVAEELSAGGITGGIVKGMASKAKNPNSFMTNIKNDPKFMQREMQASVGAGMGAATAEQAFPDNPAVEIVGSLVGGVTTQIPDPVKVPFRKAKESLVEPFTDEGAVKRVSDVLIEHTSDPEQAVRNIQHNKAVMRSVVGDAEVPTTQLAQDEGLDAAIRSIADSDAKVLSIISNGERDVNERLLAQLNQNTHTVATPADAIAATRRVISGLTSRLEDMITLSKDKADELIARQKTAENPEQLGQDFYNALNGGYKNARGIEKKIWSRVDKAEKINLSPLVARINKIANKTKARPIDEATIPTAQFNAASKLQSAPGTPNRSMTPSEGNWSFDAPSTPKSDKGNMQRLMDYRSNLLQAKREAIAAGNTQKAQILTEVEQEVAKFIDNAGTSPAYRAAAEYTRTMHHNYTRGKLGRILGYEKTGAERIDPEKALEAIVRPRGEGAARGDDVVTVAKGETGKFPSNPAVLTPVEIALRDKFTEIKTPAARQKFLKDYGPILRKFPGVNKDLRELADEIDAVAERIAQLEGRKVTLVGKNKVKAAALLDTDPDRMFTETLSKLSRDEARKLMKLMTREGVESGVQQSVLTSLNDALTKAGTVKGGALTELLKNPNWRIPFEEMLSPAQQASVRAVDEAATIMAKLSQGKRVDAKKVTESGVLVDLIAKAVSSRMGTHFASGQNALIVAGAAARAGKELVNRLPSHKARVLIERALVDPDLMADLLNPSVAKNPDEYVAILRGHLASAGVRADDED